MGIIDTAKRLIDRFGQPAVLRKPGEETGPEWNPTPGAPTDHAVDIALTEYTAEQRSGTGITEADLRAFFDSTMEPTTADQVIIGGRTYAVQAVGRIYQNADAVCYDVRLAR